MLLTSLTHFNFRIERNDSTNPSFRASFVIYKSGKIQARCSKISADVTAMQAACSSVLAILHENRSQIEATPNPAGRGKTSPPPAAPSSTQRRTATALRYPKGTLPRFVHVAFSLCTTLNVNLTQALQLCKS